MDISGFAAKNRTDRKRKIRWLQQYKIVVSDDNIQASQQVHMSARQTISRYRRREAGSILLRLQKVRVVAFLIYPNHFVLDDKYNNQTLKMATSIISTIISQRNERIQYSRTSMARTLMARLPRLFRTRS